jgi:hypothetical protein
MAEEKKKSFTTYVAETKTEYKYVLKFAIHEMADDTVDKLEASLLKYDLKSASKFRKTPIQESPLDFPNIKNTPVFICDITLGYPGSLDFMRTYICNTLGLSTGQLAVYSENDPRQIETDLYLDRNSPEYKKNYKARLGTDPDDAEDVPYGETYNTEFLKTLAQVAKDRKTTVVVNALSPAETADHSTLPKGYDSFNDKKNLNKDDQGFFGRIKLPSLSKAGVL